MQQNYLQAETFDDLYLQAINLVKQKGHLVIPRGQTTKEILGSQLLLTNPLNALCLLKGRKLNYSFAIIERLEYLSGQSNPERLCFYNKNMQSFVNEQGGFDGAYGPRIQPQLEHCYELLTKDSSTRQAIITINDQRDRRESKDKPCTLSLQFLLRDNKLNCITTMRSNDLLWGTPYDISAFCFLQEVLASWLDVELGWYLHQPASLHYYIELEDKLNFNEEKNEQQNYSQFNLTKKETIKELNLFLLKEQLLREHQLNININLTSKLFIEYWKEIWKKIELKILSKV